MSGFSSYSEPPIDTPEVILIGSGIMSANLGVMLKCLEPRLKIQLFEVTDDLAQESSEGWNNAGTGHAGLCELSYTPKREANGSVNVSNAISIFEQFEHSKQFWSYAVAQGLARSAGEFIHSVPHIGFAEGQEDVDFLRARHQAMADHHFFKSMDYSVDPQTLSAWAPLVIEGREAGPVAATRAIGGTEVDFGRLSRSLLGWLAQQEGCSVAAGHRVTRLRKTSTGWTVAVTQVASGEQRLHRAPFVFVGAGGGSLPLLQTAHLVETHGMAGFPIGGQWLVCDTPEVVARHAAKVYGRVPPSMPSLGGPHLDRRRLNQQNQLLFGPFASWTTQFLHKTGRHTDLPLSIRPGNLSTLIKTGLHAYPLVRYLIAQGLQSMSDRIATLRTFYPRAQASDWRLIEAGIRVQSLKKSDHGALSFGTSVFTPADRSLAALLGASPGASVSVPIALEVIKKCLPHLLETPLGHSRMKAMIPTYDEDLKQSSNADRFESVQAATDALLELKPTRK